MHPRTSGIGALVVVLVVLVVLAGATGHSRHTSAAPASVPSAAPFTQPGQTTALALLATLPIKGRAPKTGYARDQFGSEWTDNNFGPLGHNGCDTRNDILRRDLTNIALKPNSNGCAVLTGVLLDPYTANTIQFTRGTSTSLAVQIDHVVALSNAWQTGAGRWSPQTRTDLANDPLNLLAVDGLGQRGQGRRRRRHLAASEQGLPLCLRRTAGRGQSPLRALGHSGRARRRRTSVGHLPHPAGPDRERNGDHSARTRHHEPRGLTDEPDRCRHAHE